MTPRTKVILIVLLLMIVILAVIGVSYWTSKKAAVGPSGEPLAPPSEEQITKAPKVGRFSLGEFVATSRDEELHYIKIEVEVGYVGNIEKELEERKGELRDAVLTILMKMTIQRAKEDYVDHFLHKDIEKKLNETLGTTTSESRIVKVYIPQFLIN